MTGKEIVLQAFRHEKTERAPWVPYTGVHVGSLNDTPADALLNSEDKLLAALLKSNELYYPDGQSVNFDLQVEAEILGCGLKWDRKAPPSVISHPLETATRVDLALPGKDDGRIPVMLAVTERFARAVGDHTALFGLFCGPFTLSSHLRGLNLFKDIRRKPDFVEELADFTTRVSLRMAEYYRDCGAHILAVVDPLISQIPPTVFDQFYAAGYTEIFNTIRSFDMPSSFFVCGDATKNLEVMCRTHPDGIAIDENIDILAAKQITDRHDITIAGNIPLSAVMLLGNQQDNQKYAIDLMDQMGTHNFILAPGCDMPYDLPSENVIGISQAVHNVQQTRTFLHNYVKPEIDMVVEMPDYGHLTRPLIEVFTIDSMTCAACTYMKAAAFAMQPVFGAAIEVIERKGTEMENIVRMGKLGIKNLPAILINGQLKYSSIIPDQEELKAEVQKVLD